MIHCERKRYVKPLQEKYEAICSSHSPLDKEELGWGNLNEENQVGILFSDGSRRQMRRVCRNRAERLQMEEQPLPRRGGWLQQFLSSSSVSIGILRELDWGVEDFQFIYKCSKEFLLSFFKITFFFFFLLRNFQSVKSKSEMQRALFNKNSGCFRVYQVFYLEN